MGPVSWPITTVRATVLTTRSCNRSMPNSVRSMLNSALSDRPSSLTETTAGKEISLVAFNNVKSPVIVTSPSSFGAEIEVIWNFAVGYSFVSKKSGELRCVVRSGWNVASEFVSISTETDFSVLPSVSSWAVPLNFWKLHVRGSGRSPTWVPTNWINVFSGPSVAAPEESGTRPSATGAGTIGPPWLP